MSEGAKIDASQVAFIIPVGGVASAWPRCARSLAALDPPPGKLVVVLDGPHPEHAVTAGAIAGVRVVELEERGGPARARNRGAAEVTQEILFFVDSDIEVPPDLAAKVAAIFDADDELTAVIGSYDDAPGDPHFLSQYRNLLHHFVHQHGHDEASTFWTGCGAVRRRAFEEVAGFDESFAEPSIEDIELGARLRRRGHSIRLVKDLQVKHLKHWRLGDMLHTDLWRRAVPWTRLMIAEKEIVNDLNVKTRDRVSVVMAFLALLALPGAWLWPPLLALFALAMLSIVALNGALFRFFLRQRGLLFTAGVTIFYWIYLLICGLGFAFGLLSSIR